MNNKYLYNIIMRNVSREVKRILNEDIQNFNPVDYEDDEHDIIDQDTVFDLSSYHPKTKEELQDIIEKKVEKERIRLRGKRNQIYNIDLTDVDISKIIDMSYLFLPIGVTLTKNNKRWTLDISNWNLYRVRNMGLMFGRCETLIELNLSNFDTANVTNMYGMFSECKLIEKLDLSSFNVGNVEKMRCMFDGCESLQEIDFSGWETKKLTDMSTMFGKCQSLTELDLSGFNTDKVTHMDEMFNGCTNLKHIDLKNFDTSSVLNMKGMFKDCISLRELDLSHFDTSECCSMANMFTGCINLEYLDLTNFKAPYEKNHLDYMFIDCYNLSNIKVNDRYIMAQYNDDMRMSKRRKRKRK